eukprot:CAMPEP_0202848496 /NCGR_PEP_ID=MMETSP1389-20130828/78260_1 /ASSEMBLY_ACC=CAM_ASM_000865 /TAXON_ID=302021 /ORGANISM="Rhodomonas sp., Strain CCMP768" /LENGTH=92 /DNA_ID=CAMNT_0049526377 /DNA_START=1 /DNA_END=279 /DNA_ORIENTATION=-
MIIEKAAEIDAAEAKWKVEQKFLAQRVVAEADKLAGTSVSAPHFMQAQLDEIHKTKQPPSQGKEQDDPLMGEPTGQGETFEPGTWDPTVGNK